MDSMQAMQSMLQTIRSFIRPPKSSTYKKQPCHSQACRSLDPFYSSGPLCDDKNFCKYGVVYSDESFSKGDLSLESFTFETTSGKPVLLPKVAFGCGHESRSKFNKLIDGIVGLGTGNLSIVNQLSSTINGKFSYCMVPLKSNMSSKISFGSNAVVSGSGVQRTPLFTENLNRFYYLNLERISIVDANIEFETETSTDNANANDGNIFIDSGTTLTYFPREYYQKIEDAFKSIISSTPVEGEKGLRLCYKNEKGFKEKVPTITFHFTGADWELGVSNTMVELDDGKICFTMAPGQDAVFGNLQQMNFMVGYDLNGKTLSFMKTDCTKQ